MKYSRLRGTQDIVPPQIDTWRAVESVFARTFDRFGYQWIRTPIIESTDLFVRAVGEQSDIVTKEMYTFSDRGGRSITLRPENTAPVIRAYLENGLHRRGGVQRLCYTGPMFRYDRPQAGRYRQFYQVGAEAIGSDHPAIDVEMIQLVVDAFVGLGFTAPHVRVNSVGTELSRAPYRERLLAAMETNADAIAPDSLRRYRLNPLRIFDAKDVDNSLKSELPVISDYLVGRDAEHFNAVCSLLRDAGVHFVHDERLVRGLDYYTNTVFEMYSGAPGGGGAQSALCGGGRYDSLVEECGGAPTAAIGFSAGLERIIAALPDARATAQIIDGAVEYCVLCVGDGAAAQSLRTAAQLRALGNTTCDLSGRSRKKQLAAAHKSGARFAVVVDAQSDTLEVHDFSRNEQFDVSADELPGSLMSRRETGDAPA